MRSVLAGILQGSILGPLLFFVYINDLPNELKSSSKLFADDISLFFLIVKGKDESANILNNDLLLASKQAYNRKMHFNPDPIKLNQEVLFSRKKESLDSSNHESQQCSG